MKQKVIEFLQNLPKEKYDQFNEAFELYRKSSNKNESIERAMNAAGFSERGLENLLYDLQKLHGITDVEKIASVKMAVVSDQSAESIQGLVISGQDSDVNDNNVVNMPKSDDDAVNILRQENALRQAQDDNEILASENEDLQFEKEELEEENEGLKDELESLKSLPKIDAKSIRVEFPFLNEKDCPDEFKILVADKITAWNTYLENHAEMLKIEAGEVAVHDEYKAKIAKAAVDAFDENQKIYDELNAYQTTGKVLGLHPIFKRLQLTREVEAMTSEELVKYKSSSAKYFTDNRQSLVKAEKAKDTEKIELINNRVAERELKLALVNKKLGINPK